MWEPKQGVRCILRTVTPPIVCPDLGLLVVHVAGPFTQISGMEVGEGMEGHGTKCDCCSLNACCRGTWLIGGWLSKPAFKMND